MTRAPLTRGAWIVAAATVAWHLATATIYSYHRDELYYLASGRRMAWGYADHPPLTPLLYRVGDRLFGSSLLGLRVMPALLHGVIVLLTALLARELGGSARAQFVAALGAAVAPMFLSLGHFLGTVTAEVALWAPNLLWQAQRGWPQLTLSAHIRNYAQGVLTAPYQFVLLGVVSGMLALPGLLWLLRNPAAHRFRSLGIAFVAIVVLVTLTGGKPYYAGVFGPVLIAAGAAAGAGPAGRLLPILLVGTGLVIAPFAQPLLPVATANVVRGLNQEVGEMLGWPHLVDVVAGVYRHHPGATIFTANYSEAASIEVLGRARGLPQPVSGHNGYWWWGHPHGRSDVTVAVGFPRRYLEERFGRVELAATFHSPGGVHNMEDGAGVFVCRDQRADWDTLWSTRIKHIE